MVIKAIIETYKKLSSTLCFVFMEVDRFGIRWTKEFFLCLQIWHKPSLFFTESGGYDTFRFQGKKDTKVSSLSVDLAPAKSFSYVKD
jgi:hypothetical protein